jgi:hypothetical protein
MITAVTTLDVMMTLYAYSLGPTAAYGGYCAQRYKSYAPASDLGYDGMRHPYSYKDATKAAD